MPTLPVSKFLSNFTLGFADGFTVPFALSAGLSSLSQTKTVIYAGLAEICAGSISMGIGGYLAARGERLSQYQHRQVPEDVTRDGGVVRRGRGTCGLPSCWGMLRRGPSAGKLM